MQRIFPSALTTFHPDSGIDAIARHATTQPIFFDGEDLQPSAASEQRQLTQLFPLRSLEDFIWERLAPAYSGTGFLMPSRFRTTLSTLCLSVRALARCTRDSNRRYGRLAQLLDDQDELTKLATIYFHAQLEG